MAGSAGVLGRGTERPTDPENLAVEGLDAIVRRVVADITTRTTTPELPTGIPTLDAHIWGLHRDELTIIGARPGEGKCLGVGTPVMMANGTTKTVECLQIGDAVMGPDSRPRIIRSITSGLEPLYEIQQRNGLWYTVNESHLLSLQHDGRTIRNIAVREYLRQSKKFQQRHKGYKVPVEFPEQPIPIPPYILGLWLGDGTSANQHITTADPEVVEEIQAFAKAWHLLITKQRKSENKATTYSLVAKHGTGDWQNHPNRFLLALRQLTLLNNKHIPSDYLLNSREIRLQLLAGLIDSDGAINNYGLIFYNTNERLAEQVCGLARTLGFRAQCTRYAAKLKSRNFTCTAYKVTIGGKLSQIPLRITRKRRGNSTTHTSLATNFRIIPKGVGRYYGFTLHHPDGLFLLSDCTVTHNSTLALQMAKHLADMGKRVVFVSLEMTREQLVERLLVQFTQVSAWALRMASQPVIQRFLAQIEPLWPVFERMNLRIVDQHGKSIPELRHLLHELAERAGGPPDVLIIDFIQLIRGDPENPRFKQIEDYLNDLRDLAKRYHLAMVVCSQVNREATKNLKGRPKLANLKGSGSLEEFADCVIQCWWEELGTEERPQGYRYWLLISKQRFGAPGAAIPVEFDADHLTFHAVQEPVSSWQEGGAIDVATTTPTLTGIEASAGTD